jgi:hypothetical protein
MLLLICQCRVCRSSHAGVANAKEQKKLALLGKPSSPSGFVAVDLGGAPSLRSDASPQKRNSRMHTVNQRFIKLVVLLG